ncbi:MAG: DJ-1/PfpI family protein [Myxococcota bacterium]
MDHIDLLLLEGFADWEPALLLAEIRRRSSLTLRVSTVNGRPVTSMGGLTVTPDAALSELEPVHSELLVLPGSDAWAAGDYPAPEVHALIQRFLDAGTLVGAICGATVALARGGFLAERAHTSNDPQWLAAVAPDYAGADHYRKDLVVEDQGLVTAPGTASTAFAAALLERLGLIDAETRRVFEVLYTTGRFPADADVAAYFSRASSRP